MPHRPTRRPWLGRATAPLLAFLAALAPGAPVLASGEVVQPSRSAVGNYLAARHAERQRDQSSAARFFEAALRGEAGNFDIEQRLHAALVAEGDFARALATARRIAERSPANAAAALTLAVDSVARGEWEEAGKRIAEIPLQGVNRLLFPLLRAWVEAARGNQAALEAMKPIADMAELRGIVDFHSALVSSLLGRHDDAEAAFRRVAGAEGGTTPRVAEAFAAFLLARGRDAEARAMLDAAAARDRDSLAFAMLRAQVEPGGRRPAPVDARAGFAAALFDVATVLRGEGDGALSMPYARLATVLAPADGGALLLVGDVLDQQKRHADAIAAFGRVPASSPLAWPARLRMADGLRELERLDEAMDMLEKMAAERPERIDALATKAGILRGKERFAEAAPVYDRAVARIASPERRHWTLFVSRGIAFERSGQWPKAEADFRKALDLQPEQPDVMNYLAYSWVDKGFSEHYDLALRMLERAVELRPQSGHIIDSLAWALYKLGRHAEAVPLLERAVEILPQEAVILDHLGDAYWKVGRRNEARFQWQRALGAKPEAELKPVLERKLRDGLDAVEGEKPRGG
ncbi:MAG: tetratricopeptide repeat protein [Alphaproteobacteria bacterium]